MKSIRIVLYSHDSVGLGHVRRNLALAHALSNQLPVLTGLPVTGLLVAGTAMAPSFSAPSDWDWVILPGVDKSPEGYIPRNLDVSMGDLVSLRAGLLDGVLKGFRPDLIVVDRHATGIHHELEAALRRARAASGVRIVLGLREVLDRPESALAEWVRLGGPRIVKELFDGIWIYGDPAVHDPVEAGEIPMSLRGLIHYTGYLASGRPAGSGANCMSEPYVLTTLGGGSDGHGLAVVAARAPMPAGLGHLIITGPQMPEAERRDIAGLACKGTKVVATVDDVVLHMRQAAAVISMGGYNSVCEIMSTDVPALIVPRAYPRAEQRIRAGSLAKAGYVDSHDLDTLTPENLSSWLAGRLGSTMDRRRLQLNGLVRVPQLAADQLRRVPTAGRSMVGRLKVALSNVAV